jgi:hypothetical protein
VPQGRSHFLEFRVQEPIGTLNNMAAACSSFAWSAFHLIFNASASTFTGILHAISSRAIVPCSRKIYRHILIVHTANSCVSLCFQRRCSGYLHNSVLLCPLFLPPSTHATRCNPASRIHTCLVAGCIAAVAACRNSGTCGLKGLQIHYIKVVRSLSPRI